MACNKKTITNTGSTKVYFSYQACNDFVWNYDVPLNPGETKTIWYLNNTFSSPNTNLEVNVVNVSSINVNAAAAAVTTYQLSSCCDKSIIQYVTVSLSTPLSVNRDILVGDDNVCYRVLSSGYTNQPTITWTNGVLYRNTTDCTVCTNNYRCAPPSTPTPTPTPSSCRRPGQVTTAQMFFAYTLSGVVTTFTSSFDSACYGCRIINQGAASGAYNVEIDGSSHIYNGLQSQGVTNCDTIPDGYYVYVTSVSPFADCRIAYVFNGVLISLTACSTAAPTQTVTSTPTPTPTRNSTLNCAIAQTIPGIRYSFYDCCNNNALITGIGSSNIQYFNINMLYQYSGLILADVQFNCPTPTPTLTRTKTPTPTPTNPSSGTLICFTLYANIDVGPLNVSMDINGSGTYNGKPYYILNSSYIVLWNSTSNRWELLFGTSILTGTLIGYLNSANPNYPITDATHVWITLNIRYMSSLTSVICGGPTPTPTKTVTSTNPPPTPTPTTTTPNSGSSICFSLYPYIDIVAPFVRTTLGVNGSGTYNGKPYYLVHTSFGGIGVYVIWNSTLNRWEQVEGYPTNFASALVLMSLNSANPNYPISDSTHPWTIVTLIVNHYYMSSSIFGTCPGQTPTPTPTNPPPTATPSSTHCSNDCYTFSINISANDILAATGNTGSYSGYNGQVLVAELLNCNNNYVPIITYSGAGSYQFCGKYIQYPVFIFYQNNIPQSIVQSTLINSLICCSLTTPTPTPTKTVTPTKTPTRTATLTPSPTLTQLNCVTFVQFTASTIGNVSYLDCCGNSKILTTVLGLNQISDCIKINSLSSYFGYSNPAQIGNINYNSTPCTGRTTAQLPCLTPTPTPTIPSSASTICFAYRYYSDIILPSALVTLSVNGSGTYNGKPYYLIFTSTSGVGTYIIWNSTLNRWEQVEGYPTNFASALVLMSLNSANPNYPISDSTHPWTYVSLFLGHIYVGISVFGACAGPTPTPTPTITKTSTPTLTTTQNYCAPKSGITFQVTTTGTNVTSTTINVSDCCGTVYAIALPNGIYNLGLQGLAVPFSCIKVGSLISAYGGYVSNITYSGNCSTNCNTPTPTPTKTKTPTPTVTRTSGQPLGPVDCLTGLKIEAMYWKTSEWNQFHPAGYDLVPIPNTNPVQYYGLVPHSCASAFYYIRANGVDILDARLNNDLYFGTGICNDFNNQPPWIPSTFSGRSRYSTVTLTQQDAINIALNSTGNTVTFRAICAKSLYPTDCGAPYASNQCHGDFVWIRITKPDGTVIFSSGLNDFDNYYINICGPQPTPTPTRTLSTPTPTPSQATPTPTKTLTSTPTPTGTFVYLGVNTVYMKFNYY